MASHCSENKLTASNKDPSPPLQALITSSLTLAHLAPVTLTALSFLQHINVISASGPLLLLLFAWSTFLFDLHMAPLSTSCQVSAHLSHQRDRPLESCCLQKWPHPSYPDQLPCLCLQKHLAPSEVIWFEHFLIYLALFPSRLWVTWEAEAFSCSSGM